MITPKEIVEKARRKYEAFLIAYLCGETILPFDWPAGKIPGDLASIGATGRTLDEGSKAKRGYGYSVVWATRDTKRFGQQTIAERIVINQPEDYLKLIGKDQEFGRFQADVQRIRASLPDLEYWLQSKPLRIIEYHGEWDKLIAVCEYFIVHPQPNLYIRELPIEVDTKFIERHESILQSLLDVLLPPDALNLEFKNFERRYGLRFEEPIIRFRLLDGQFKGNFGLAVDDLAIPLSQFTDLEILGNQHCIIVENKMTFLTLPRFPNAFAIWGKGFEVLTLKDVAWLHTCSIVYWGDLDAQGFQILAGLRGSFPTLKTLMMNRATFDAYQDFVVDGKAVKIGELPNLIPEENALCQYLATHNLRLEQERIPYTFAVQKLKDALM